MKRYTVAALAAVLSVGAWTGIVAAKDAVRTDVAKSDAATVKTITGKSACATCEGVTKDGHAILLIDKEGMRWVLTGEGKDYDAAHKVRKDGKTLTASYSGEPLVKKDADGKEFKEVKVTDVKIES